MHGHAKKLKDTPYIKVDISHPVVNRLNKYYESKGQELIYYIPDWFIFRYKDGKMVYFKRYIGSCSEEELTRRLKAANK